MAYKTKKSLVLPFILFAFAFALDEWKAISPTARNFATMVVDSVNERAILFGGGSYQLTGRWYNDVWEIPLVDTTRYFWLPLSISGTPPTSRGGHVFVYNPRQQGAIVFGGDTLWGNRTNDVWELNLTLGAESWTRLFPAGSPPSERSNCAGIYHPGRNSIILFGGDGNSVPNFDDTWELKLDSLRWSEIVISGLEPGPRGGYAAAFDRITNCLIIFGGRGGGQFYNDVWALDLTPGNEHWTELYPTGSIPMERAGFAYGYDGRTKKLYIFGGWNSNAGLLFDDVYVLDLTSLTWTQLFPIGEGPFMRRNPSGAYDFFNDNFIIFGGDLGAPYYHYLAETYILDLYATAISEWKKPTLNI